jgi:hypothetical protein
MTRLTTAQRRNLKPNQFAGKGRSYPVPDASHAANAKARAKQQLEAGRISKAEYDAIVAKANKVLGKGKKSLAQMLGG